MRVSNPQDVVTAFFKLIKYKLSLAVTFSSVMGWFLEGSGSSESLLFTMIGVYFLASASAALNQFQERRFDAAMPRTRHRPLPSGQLDPRRAIAISSALTLLGMVALARTGWLPAALGAANILLYNGLYTPLKRITSFALIPGGLVGAIPPMIGWTAAGGALLHPTILFVCTLMFLWQMPHFWMLIIRYGKEYEEAGFKTIMSYMSDTQIKRMVFFWICISSVFLLSYRLFGIVLPLWLALLLIIANLAFIVVFYRLLFKKIHPRHEQWLFILSNLFLIIVMILLIVSSLPRV